ncbi:hypothetical protein AB0I81_35965 [Nonomuraea sp. NPDC050404]|uniref:EF-hand domain-containing protein n=1 Tax=Nonomuraea sp. NPDC050404 TaxID=3155783 RepID=UPI0033ED3EDA
MPDDTTSRLARLRTRFSLLDINADGHLRAENFDLLAERVLDALIVKRDSARAIALRRGCRIYWQGLAAMAGGGDDDVVSFKKYAAVIPNNAHFDRYGRAYASALTSLADVNDDGQVERVDFLACMEAIGFAIPQIERTYAELSHDGAVTTEDWKTAIRDFYLSDTAYTPGQFLLEHRSA